MGGQFGSMLGGMFGGAIGAAVMSAIPNLGTMIDTRAEISQSKAKLMARPSTPKEAEEWGKVHEETRDTWMRSKAGPTAAGESLDVLQRQHFSARQSQAVVNEIMTMAAANEIGDPKEFTKAYAEMEAMRSGRSAATVAAASPAIADMIRKLVPEGHYEKGDVGSERMRGDITSGKISISTIERAVHDVATTPSTEHAAETERSFGWGTMREWGRKVASGEHLVPSLMPQTPVGQLPGMEELGSYQNVPEVHGHMAQFSSAEGLAKRMQEAAGGGFGGGGGVEEQQLAALKAIENNTKKESSVPESKETPHWK
jgi:hypothetical protein